MKILIGKRTPIKFKNSFVLTHSYMIGDANGWETFENIISKNNPFLESYLEVLDQFLISIKNIDSINDVSFDLIDQFYKNLDSTIFNFNKYKKEIKFKKLKYDETAYYTYEGYSILFYDENGVEYNCEVISD